MSVCLNLWRSEEGIEPLTLQAQAVGNRLTWMLTPDSLMLMLTLCKSYS